MTARIIVLALLLAVLASLGAGLFFLVRDRGRGSRSGKTLWLRVVLSTAVLLALALAFSTGTLEPRPPG